MPVTMQYLTWASFVFEVSGRRIVVDPYLAGFPSDGVPRSPIARADIYPLEAVVISHAGSDHFGEALEMISESEAILCGGVDVRLSALHAGIPDERIAVMVSGSTYEADGWSLKALDARHISWTRIGDAYFTGQPLTYVFDFGDVRVYYGGDTSISPDLEFYGRLYRPDVALLGVDGVLMNGRAICELTPREAALAADLLGVTTAVPMHYRDDSGEAERFLEEVKAVAPHVTARKLAYGETMALIA